jgi:hypothetical protein
MYCNPAVSSGLMLPAIARTAAGAAAGFAVETGPAALAAKTVEVRVNSAIAPTASVRLIIFILLLLVCSAVRMTLLSNGTTASYERDMKRLRRRAVELVKRMKRDLQSQAEFADGKAEQSSGGVAR